LQIYIELSIFHVVARSLKRAPARIKQEQEANPQQMSNHSFFRFQ